MSHESLYLSHLSMYQYEYEAEYESFEAML